MGILESLEKPLPNERLIALNKAKEDFKSKLIELDLHKKYKDMNAYKALLQGNFFGVMEELMDLEASFRLKEYNNGGIGEAVHFYFVWRESIHDDKGGFYVTAGISKRKDYSHVNLASYSMRHDGTYHDRLTHLQTANPDILAPRIAILLQQANFPISK